MTSPPYSHCRLVLGHLRYDVRVLGLGRPQAHGALGGYTEHDTNVIKKCREDERLAGVS